MTISSAINNVRFALICNLLALSSASAVTFPSTPYMPSTGVLDEYGVSKQSYYRQYGTSGGEGYSFNGYYFEAYAKVNSSNIPAGLYVNQVSAARPIFDDPSKIYYLSQDYYSGGSEYTSKSYYSDESLMDSDNPASSYEFNVSYYDADSLTYAGDFGSIYFSQGALPITPLLDTQESDWAPLYGEYSYYTDRGLFIDGSDVTLKWNTFEGMQSGDFIELEIKASYMGGIGYGSDITSGYGYGSFTIYNAFYFVTDAQSPFSIEDIFANYGEYPNLFIESTDGSNPLTTATIPGYYFQKDFQYTGKLSFNHITDISLDEFGGALGLTQTSSITEFAFFNAIPEPSTFVLTGIGLVLLAGFGFYQKRKI
jgi:hypothetical protein